MTNPAFHFHNYHLLSEALLGTKKYSLKCKTKPSYHLLSEAPLRTKNTHYNAKQNLANIALEIK
ncbi:hypothetical protein SAMN05421785_10592 [Chryseobacterium gambrini]|uniref:Uncharacterized protein n=1 Tax=Chryseobacterium gambrini TaxID=373672 RepID=A0A1N7NU87_9FLAO|nr:hypothetical protein SAMN05421785_10592 [Chryseobacterium gambrini]